MTFWQPDTYQMLRSRRHQVYATLAEVSSTYRGAEPQRSKAEKAFVVLVVLCVVFPLKAHSRATGNIDRAHDGLHGAVYQVTTEKATLSYQPQETQAQWQADFCKHVNAIICLTSQELRAQFVANPFRWKGEVVGFIGSFHRMLSEQRGIFVISPFQYVILTKLPTTRFTSPGETALLAGRVQGLAEAHVPFQGSIPLPELELTAIEAPQPSDPWAVWREGQRVLSDIVTYTPQGNRSEEVHFADGKARVTCLYTYRGDAIEVVRHQPEKPLTKWVYTFDEQGNQTGIATYGADETLQEETTFAYDVRGNVTKKAGYTRGESLNWRESFLYDPQGNLKEITSYDKNEAMASKTVFTYNPTTRQKIKNTYNTNGSVVSQRYSTSNKQGRVTEEAVYEKDILREKTEYIYDTQGNMLQEVFYTYTVAGALQSKTIQTYNERGDLTEQSFHSPDRSRQNGKGRYLYDYDVHGNWTKRLYTVEVTKGACLAFELLFTGGDEGSCSSFEPSSVTHRTITYWSSVPQSSQARYQLSPPPRCALWDVLLEEALDTAFAEQRAKGQVEQVQKRLKAVGLDPGPIDGMFGPRTKEALRQYQAASGLPVTGELDTATLQALGVQ